MKRLIFILIVTSILGENELKASSEHEESQLVKKPCKKEDRSTACVILQGKDRPAVSLDASFLYYFLAEDGLDLANSAAVITSGTSAGEIISVDSSQCLVQNFKYTPGLKAGIGASWEEWDLKAEYTWLSQTTAKRKEAPSVDPLLGSGVWILNNWFQQTSTSGQPIAATETFAKWHIDINLVDLTVKRSIYEGCSLSLVPFFGITGNWIYQHLNVQIDVSSEVITNLATSNATSHNISHSWGLGPIVGCNFYWLLPKNFSVEGSGMVGLLFTRFSKVKHWENVASASSQPDQLSVQLPNVNCIRPQASLSLGLDWGTYLKEKLYYLNFAVTYDFLLFWQQNMMRKLMDQTLVGIGAPAGDLYLQGLGVKAGFYF